MEMRPLLQAIADGDTVAFVYEMYLTPKGMENAPTFTMMAILYSYCSRRTQSCRFLNLIFCV